MTKISKKNINSNLNKIQELKLELSKIRLNIKAGKEKNTNSHKKLKLEIAQLLTNKEDEKKA
jgi:ribosomal protein L29